MKKSGRINLKEKIYFTLFKLSAIFGFGILILVLVLLIKQGASVIDWRFLSQYWQHRDITQAGIFPAIIGSLYLGIGVLVITFPLGVATAIYLTEYNRQKNIKRIIELAIRNLAGVPSIIFGLFGLAIFVNFLNFGTSLLSAILTLSLMSLPWIITASVEALNTVPKAFRESSMALGASRWQTIRLIILPAALPGCITGGILGIGRALGETAPIIIVGATFFLAHLPTSTLDKFMALPYHTFILATQHSSPLAPAYAAGTALVLIALTFFLSLGAILVRYYFRSRKDW